MPHPRRRLVPLLLAVVFLLTCALGAALAQERRGRSRDANAEDQRQSAPASRPARTSPETRSRVDPAPPARAPYPAPAPPARSPYVAPASPASPAPASPASPYGRPSWGAGARPASPYAAPQNPRPGWNAGADAYRGRPEQANPYTRYRTPERDSRAAPSTGEQGRVARGRPELRAEPDSGWGAPAPRGRVYRTQPEAAPEVEAPATRGRGYGSPWRQPRATQDPVTPRRSARPQPAPATRSAEPDAERPVRSPYDLRPRTRPQCDRVQDDQPAARGRDRRSDAGQVRGRPAPRTSEVQVPQRPQPRVTSPRSRPEPEAGARPGPRGDRRLSVPEARFRGPEADRQVRRVDPREQARVQTDLNRKVREWNRTRPVLQQGRLTRDVVGNPVPRDARVIHLDRASHTRASYHRVTSDCGTPSHYYTFQPRRHDDYWDGYWDGYRNGWWDGRAHVPHRPPVVVSLFYGFYWSDPLWFGFYYPGYYPAVYHYWGWTPGWVYPTRGYVNSTEYIYTPPFTPYRYYSPGSYVDEPGAARAIGDLRRSWLQGSPGLLSRHLTDQLDVQVYFDGEYSYTTSTDDYYAMTADALATTQTVALDFDAPIWLSAAEVFYTGRHVFYDPDGMEQTVYISYRLRHLGSEWYIVAIGSSLNPIEHHYHDFRYS